MSTVNKTIDETSETYVVEGSHSLPYNMIESMMPELYEFIESEGLNFTVSWSSGVEDTYRGDYYNFQIKVYLPKDTTSPYCSPTRSLAFVFQHWDECCAQGIISGLSWDFDYDNRIDSEALSEAIAPGLKRMLRHKTCVHKIQFAYSEEEVSYQDWLAKNLGFVDITETYISCKTGNTIHNTMLNLASDKDEEHAQNMYNENNDMDEYYDDEDDSGEW